MIIIILMMICGFVVLRGPLKEHVVFPDPNKGPNGTEPRKRTLTWAYLMGSMTSKNFNSGPSGHHLSRWDSTAIRFSEISIFVGISGPSYPRVGRGARKDTH